MAERGRNSGKKLLEKARSKRPQRKQVRPPLTPQISLYDFHNHYWYLKELSAFCRKYGLATSGQKLDLVARIEAFLTTGRRDPEPGRAPARTRSHAAERMRPITLDTRVTDDYKCDAETRSFFKSVIGKHFHFTAHLQRFRREQQRKGVPLTYGDLVREWLAEQERRKNPDYKSKITRSWEYNQFVRDFMADKPRNTGVGLSEAAQAWNTIRVHRGPHTYAEYLRLKRGIGEK
jgi:SAP domain-containing new25/Domain of unknown function (DUF6434)